MTALILLAALAAQPAPNSIYRLHIPLIDQDGHAVALDQFRGHPVLVTMFYGSCPQACPLLVSKMKLLEQRLTPAARADLRVLLVSLDPERDTPAQLKALANAHGVDEARWRFTRTDDAHVRTLAAVLGVKYHRLNNGELWHSSVIVVLDREGQIAGRAEGLELDVPQLEGAVSRVP